MKKLIFLSFVFTTYSLSMFSQGAMLTYDTRNDVNMTNQYMLGLKNLGEAANQSSFLKDIYNFSKKAEEVLKKVNRAVKDITYVESIIKRETTQIRWYGYYLSSAKGFKYVSTTQLSMFTNQLGTFLSDSQDLLKMAQLFLQDDYLTMSDEARIKFLKEIDDKMSENYTNMEIEYNHLSIVNSDAEFNETIKKW